MSASRRVRARVVPAGGQARRDRARRKIDALYSNPAIRAEQLALARATARLSSAQHVVWDDTEPGGEDAAASRIDPLAAARAFRATLDPEAVRRAGLTGASVVREDRDHRHPCDQRLDEVLDARERLEAVAVLRSLADDTDVPEHRRLLIAALADRIDSGVVGSRSNTDEEPTP